MVADGSDNFDTRYLVSDACFYAKKPLVTAAVGQFDGSLTTLRPFETGPDGKPNPTYRCLFPQKPPPGALPTCAEAGVLGALTGMVGSLMALEVVREIVGFGTSMVGRLALFDLAAMRFETLSYGWDEDNPLNGKSVDQKRLNARPTGTGAQEITPPRRRRFPPCSPARPAWLRRWRGPGCGPRPPICPIRRSFRRRLKYRRDRWWPS